jgi:exosortase H (IPTLxxWG-CTERM-specific)
MSQPTNPNAEPPAEARTASQTRESLRIGILFLVFTVGLYVLRLWEPVSNAIIEPFTRFIAAFTGFLLGFTGTDVVRDDTIIYFGNIPLNILEECNGVPAFIVYLAAILAYPASLKAKGIGFLLGFPVIFLVNEVRVLSLFFFYKYTSYEIFNLMHVYVWQIAIIVVAVLLWLYWAERFVRKAGPTDSAS